MSSIPQKPNDAVESIIEQYHHKEALRDKVGIAFVWGFIGYIMIGILLGLFSKTLFWIMLGIPVIVILVLVMCAAFYHIGVGVIAYIQLRRMQ